MNLTTYKQAGEFLEAALPSLLCEEAKNNLMVGISMRLREGRPCGDGSPLFLTVKDGEELVAAAIRTPPYPLILHCESDRLEALEVIADHLVEIGYRLPGANGTVPVVTAFAEAWRRRTLMPSVLLKSLCIYSLTTICHPVDIPGHVRWATEGDIPTLAKWFLAFHEEAMPDDPPANPEASIRLFMNNGKLAVWEHDGLVSMAGSSRGTPNGATVSAVYTPPGHRGHGYASACVAALSQALLDDGNRFCTLYTDLSNPTSNKIYQNVGYRPIADCAMVRFEESKD